MRLFLARAPALALPIPLVLTPLTMNAPKTYLDHEKHIADRPQDQEQEEG